jgi:hypothetical protein
VAYKRLDARDGGNCNWLRSYINWHHCRINHNQLGSCIDEYIVKLIAISSDHVLMDVDSGFDSGFDGQFHLAVLGNQSQQSIQQLSREAFTGINQEGVTACC